VGGDGVRTEALGQLKADLLHQLARVDEDQRGTMLLGQSCELVIDLRPHRGGCDGAEFVGRNLDGEIERAALADLHDGCGAALRVAADQEVRDQLNRVLRRGEADALRRLFHSGKHRAGREPVCATDQRVQPLQRQSEVRAALVVGDGVNLIHDDRANAREVLA
jgi:hypothetical protein